eukprot:12905991-Alexandrium_andersonii.AAC.1
MRSFLITVECTPVAIGSRRASMAHKMHAFVHALFLLSGSWNSVSRIIKNVIGWTCDLGTERLLSRFPKVPMARLVS